MFAAHAPSPPAVFWTKLTRPTGPSTAPTGAVKGALKKHINEFTTHDLVRLRAGPGGQQVYWCHFPGETMEALLQVHSGA